MKTIHGFNENVKNYKCDSCDLSFGRISQLRSHISVKHTVARYTCDICDKSFKICHNLELHMLAFHTYFKE